MQELILRVRKELKESSALGEYGDAAIRRELLQREIAAVPSVRTIGRVLERHGVLDGHRRIRRPAPPPGWYLPDVAERRSELDSFDVVEDLIIEGGVHVDVLNGISLHGGLIGSWPVTAVSAVFVTEALIGHWRRFGLPDYAQFDNDTRFQGAHQWKDTIGRVTRLCLSLGVTPVFAPPRESGFQAAIESFNARWQSKVWGRFHHESLSALQAQSARYVAAHHLRSAARIDSAPPRHKFPGSWKLDLDIPRRGRIIFVRRTTDHGDVTIMGNHFGVDQNWIHRLVRAEVDLNAGRVTFCALRRKDPKWQPLLASRRYRFPVHRFKGRVVPASEAFGRS
jgi:putative transposase